MKTLAICTPHIENVLPESSLYDFDFCGENIAIGLLEAPDANYSDQMTKHSVIVEVKAFSCNYRDKSILLNAYQKCKDLSNQGRYFYSPFGSEFVAEVVEIGKSVTNLKVGDRVIPDASYPYRENSVLGGLPTNYASQRIHIFNEDELIKIPDSMSNETAACFTIAAQTVYSIVRRLDLKPQENILITAATSNTSLALINALRDKNSKWQNHNRS